MDIVAVWLIDIFISAGLWYVLYCMLISLSWVLAFLKLTLSVFTFIS